MIISRSQIGKAVQAYADQLRGSPQAQPGPLPKPGQDRVVLSAEASQLAEARRLLQSIPEVRTDRVREITRAMARGEYQVSAGDIAEKMIGRMLVDRIE
ncbi:MAG: flagellar biosynthesis anti-sigma factor FlgM [Bacillota bacterium]